LKGAPRARNSCAFSADFGLTWGTQPAESKSKSPLTNTSLNHLKAVVFPSGFHASIHRLSLRPGNSRGLTTSDTKEIDMNSLATIRCTAAVLAALSCIPALAEVPAEPTKTIQYADLNLKSSAGIATLYQRIERAARDVCQLPKGTLQLKLEKELKTCKMDATDRAVLQANLPALSALHVAKTGRKVDSGQYADRR
jgi:UrcA family protein